MVNLTELLEYIPPSQLNYLEWVNVGMALKHEGYSCEVWDSWSKSDSRYKPGDCLKKWETFRETNSNIVTGGTLYEMAVQRGFHPDKLPIRALDWDDEIQYDGDTVVKDTAWLDTSNIIEEPAAVGTDDLRRFVQTLFKPDEIVGFCIDAEYDPERKKWKPVSKGSYGMTAKQILNAIKKHPDHIEEVIGDYNPEAGAWIRFNPLDGKGVANSNVTDLRYALVESDDLELEKQKALVEELNLPVAIMTYSGGKSVHSIVKIDAITEQDYREKVDYLYAVCEKNGLKIDKQNKNQSRMTRMPGVIRGNKKQFIIAENIGAASFDEWKDYIEDSIDTLPEIITFSDLKEMPPLSPELISGILRKGHKMLISGASKAGKSFLLIELALCITQGKKWLGFQCSKGKVLYINLEVDGNSFLNRINEVKKGMGLDITPEGLDVWNLRGENAAIDKLAPRLLRRAKNKGYDVIVFDPLYKVNQSDENSASEMAKFFNHLDAICVQLNTSIICCHHHSKGAQGGKFSIDRASGSGVFARDPDALLDMIQLNPKDAEKSLPDGQTAWRISAVLREFKTPDDIDVIFDYPVHHLTNDLKDAKPMSGAGADVNSKRGNATKKEKAEKRYERIQYFVENWDEIKGADKIMPYPKLTDVAEYFKNDKGFSIRTIRNQIEAHDEYIISDGCVIPNPESCKTE